MTREQKVRKAQQLRAKGLLMREVAEEMGVSISSVNEWLHDPDGSKLRERHQRFMRRHGAICVDCGGRTSAHKVGDSSERCRTCDRRHRHETALWTRETVVEAIQAWADEYGAPPMAAEWHSESHACFDHERFYNGPVVAPWHNTVRSVFGSFNAALQAAGFTPHRVFTTPYRDNPELFLRRVVKAYRSGDSMEKIASDTGISPTRVHQLLIKAGVPRRSRQEAQQLRRAA